MVRRRPLIALFFFLLGVPVCGCLLLMSVLATMAGGLGDGATGVAEHGSSAQLVLPFAIYFGCGTISALTTRRRVRRVSAVIGHLTIFACLLFVSVADAVTLLIIIGVVFTLFAVAWIRLLCDETSRIYQLTASRCVPAQGSS